MLLANIGQSSRQLNLKLVPSRHLRLVLLCKQQPHRLLGTQLSDTGDVFHPKSVENFSARNLAITQAQWTLYLLGNETRHCLNGSGGSGHENLLRTKLCACCVSGRNDSRWLNQCEVPSWERRSPL